MKLKTLVISALCLWLFASANTLADPIDQTMKAQTALLRLDSAFRTIRGEMYLPPSLGLSMIMSSLNDLATVTWTNSIRFEFRTILASRTDLERSVFVDTLCNERPDLLRKIFPDFPAPEEIEFSALVTFLQAHSKDRIYFDLAARMVGREYQPQAASRDTDLKALRAALNKDVDNRADRIESLVALKVLRRHSIDRLFNDLLSLRASISSNTHLGQLLIRELIHLVPQALGAEKRRADFSEFETVKTILAIDSTATSVSEKEKMDLIRSRLVPLQDERSIALLIDRFETTMPTDKEIKDSPEARTWISDYLLIFDTATKIGNRSTRNRLRKALDKLEARLDPEIRFRSLYGDIPANYWADWRRLKVKLSNYPKIIVECGVLISRLVQAQKINRR